jgi:hypothetical protein
MKLYKVTIEHTFLMVAADNLDAELNAESAAREAVREDFGIEVLVGEEITKLDEVPAEWRDCYPYGEDGNERTCKEWLVG